MKENKSNSFSKPKTKTLNMPKNPKTVTSEPETGESTPKSLIIHQGTVGVYLKKLEMDLRGIMAPETATQLKIKSRNKLKDFITVAPSLGISHIWSITLNKKGNPNLKIINLPDGPTVYFKISNYSLASDVVSTIKKNLNSIALYSTPPLLIMNNLSKTQSKFPQLTLMRTLFQNIFTTINVNTFNAKTAKRCVLVDYNQEEDILSIRHYAIKLLPVGLSKGVKKIITRRIPNLANHNDISDVLLNGGEGLSESEAEIDIDSEVIINNKCEKFVNQKQSIRLYEIGPRLDLKLFKIESGVCQGSLLYHGFKEIDVDLEAKINEKHSKQKKADITRKRRREIQEGNVKRKEDAILSQKPSRKTRKLEKEREAKDKKKNKSTFK